jgi:hypothetical protein
VKHIFVRTVRYRDDPFHGLCEYVSRHDVGEIIRLDLDDDDYARVWKVEYSIRKYFRVLYYRRIFEFLRRRLVAVIPAHAPCVVYFSDEGIWAEVWCGVRRQIGNRQLRAINVQHGFATMAAVRTPRIRGIANTLSRAAFGYPNFGLGSAGGSGRFAFDAYLTYDAATARFVAERTGAIALATPYLIKSDVLSRAGSTPVHSHRVEGPVLFALQPRIRGGLIKGNLRATFDQLEPLARALKQLRKTLVLRLHPGMNRDVALRIYRNHRISAVAALDEVADLDQSLLASEAVLSFYSTVLWEAHLLGLVAVQVQSSVCRTAAVQYPHHDLDLTRPFFDQLARIMDVSTRPRTPAVQVRQQSEWRALRDLYGRWSGTDEIRPPPRPASRPCSTAARDSD